MCGPPWRKGGSGRTTYIGLSSSGFSGRSSTVARLAGTWLFPYTTFIAQIAAVGAAAVVAAIYLRPRLDRDGLLATTAVVVAVIAGAAGLARLWDSLRTADASRADFAAPRGVAYREICLTEGGDQKLVAYARWADRTLPDGILYEGVIN